MNTFKFAKEMGMKLYNGNEFLLKVKLMDNKPNSCKEIAVIDDYGFPLTLCSDGDDIKAYIDFPEENVDDNEEKENNIMNTLNNLSINYINHKTLINPESGKEYDLYEITPEYIVFVDPNNGNKLVTGWCGTLNEDEDNIEYIKKYERLISIGWTNHSGDGWEYISKNGNHYELRALEPFGISGYTSDECGCFKLKKNDDGEYTLIDEFIDWCCIGNDEKGVLEYMENRIKEYENGYVS